MPTKLEKGKVVLDAEHTIAEEGKEMNSDQTALLKLFGVTMAEFKVQVLAYWSASTQAVTAVEPEVDGMEEG